MSLVTPRSVTPVDLSLISNGPPAGPAALRPPLVIDLDGTLVRTDLLWEAFFALLYKAPLQALLALLRLPYGKAAFKAAVAERQPIDAPTLPYCQAVLDLGRQARRSGRDVILATAADHRHADAVASHLGFFSAVVASDGRVNLSAERKTRRLQDMHPEGYDYIGNSSADLAVWMSARSTLAVGPQRGLIGAARRRGIELEIIPGTESSIAWRHLVKIARLSQWSKNLLIFAPLILGHAFAEPVLVLRSVIAFFAFSLCASATYILNDLSDIASDRQHPRKRHRPLAAGKICPQHAVAFACLLFVPGIALACVDGLAFVLSVLGYILCTTIYSMYLKPILLADVLALCFFYMYRVLLGGIATGIALSHWLLVFCGFFFLSLALAKRYSELSIRGDSVLGDKRRSYVPADAPILASLGTSSCMASALVLSLYIRGETAVDIYGTPELLWAWVPLVLYWVSRIWLLAARGSLTDDPLLFAIKDRVSYVVAIGMFAAFVAASY